MRWLPLTLALSLLSTAPAWGAPVFVGVAARGDDAGLAERARGRLAEILKDRVTDASSARDALNDESAVREALRRVQTARALFLEVDFDGALTELDEALIVFEDGPAFSRGESFRDVLSEMLVLRALILARLGRDPEMRSALARLVSALPGYRPDPAEVPPAIVSEHNKLRKSRKRRRKLVVESSPPGEVTLNGIARGTTPVTIEKLAPGIHYLSVRGEGEVFRRVVRLRGKSTNVDVSLGDPRVTAARVVTAALERGVEEEGDIANMIGPLGDDIVAAVLIGPTILVGHIREGRVRNVVQLNIDTNNSGLGLVGPELDRLFKDPPSIDEALLARLLGRRLVEELPIDPIEPGDGSWLLVTGVVVGVVVVAAAATAGGIVLANAGPTEQGFNLRIDAGGLQ